MPSVTNLGASLFTFNVDDLLLFDAIRPLQGARSHYILISAFCCSTLLARYFDLMPGCLVLREPGLLGQLALLRNHSDRRVGRSDWAKDWKSWAGVGLALLSRAFEPSGTVVVKAADICNNMAQELLERDPRSRVVLLSVPLRTFVLSCLKSEERRSWMRQRARFWHRESLARPEIPGVDIDRLDDARKSAYLWLATEALWNEARRGRHGARTLDVNGEDVANAPRETMQKLAAFFDVSATPTDLDRVLTDPTSKRHAKQAGRSFDANARQRDVKEWERRYGGLADAAVGWAREVVLHSVKP